ncbi:EF-hand domain-containing protein [Xanthomonas theicola]|uniref:EF-hand domain-containing protein n=1 Tax=Xanthomonas theicola TaxID=56464 RepID=A0A2S6ZGS1_9XANT|nr:EF-hand domain-containing protein [Xanthomonas theicola]PPT91447.1 hypothetical protein XthCFBP4691_07435 [Xanthomonas theicola]QNH24467.1 hypothetical protein G4Q83_06490 [Xanthomonas theicola]
MLDSDHRGSISLQELEDAMRPMGPPPLQGGQGYDAASAGTSSSSSGSSSNDDSSSAQDAYALPARLVLNQYRGFGSDSSASTSLSIAA